MRKTGLHGARSCAAVRDALHAVARRVPPLANTPALYRDPYISRDVTRYRAAAIALAYLESTLWRNYCTRHLHWYGTPSEEILVQAMADWRGLFSPDGRSYRSLNRTLMNLPIAVPAELVCHLNQIRLERPITGPLELTVLLLVVSNRKAGGALGGLANRTQLFQHATEAQIEDALARIAASTGRTLCAQRLDDVRFALRFLADFPEPCGDNLTRFAQRAIRWHRDAPQREARQGADALGGADMPTAEPSVALPDIPGIAFLATVGAVIAEGQRMQHCIGSYAREAMHGKCFLFHVDYQGETASIEVDARGMIGQCCGPQNTENTAATWGRRQLETWAARLRQRQRCTIPRTTITPDNE